MNVKSIVKKLIQLKSSDVAKQVLKIINADIVDFNDQDVLNLIYEKFEKTNNNALLNLYQDITKNGIKTY